MEGLLSIAAVFAKYIQEKKYKGNNNNNIISGSLNNFILSLNTLRSETDDIFLISPPK